MKSQPPRVRKMKKAKSLFTEIQPFIHRVLARQTPRLHTRSTLENKQKRSALMARDKEDRDEECYRPTEYKNLDREQKLKIMVQELACDIRKFIEDRERITSNLKKELEEFERLFEIPAAPKKPFKQWMDDFFREHPEFDQRSEK